MMLFTSIKNFDKNSHYSYTSSDPSTRFVLYANYALDAHVERGDINSRIFGINCLRRMFQSLYTPYAIRNNRLFFEFTVSSNSNFVVTNNYVTKNDKIAVQELFDNVISDRIVAQIINNLKSKLPGLVDLIFLDSDIVSQHKTEFDVRSTPKRISLRFLISTTTFLGDVDFFLKRFGEFILISTNNEMSNIEIRHLNSVDEINEYWNRVFDRSLRQIALAYEDVSYPPYLKYWYSDVEGYYEKGDDSSDGDLSDSDRPKTVFIPSRALKNSYSPGFFYLGCWNKLLNEYSPKTNLFDTFDGANSMKCSSIPITILSRYPPFFHFSLLRFSEYYPDVEGRVVNEDSNFILEHIRKDIDLFNSRFVFYGKGKIEEQSVNGNFAEHEVFRPSFAEIIYATQFKGESELSSFVDIDTHLNLYNSNRIIRDIDKPSSQQFFYYIIFKSLLKQFFKLNQMIVKGEDYYKADVFIWSEKNNCYILFSSFKNLIFSEVFRENFIPYMVDKGFAEFVNFISFPTSTYNFWRFSYFFFEKDYYSLSSQYDRSLLPLF